MSDEQKKTRICAIDGCGTEFRPVTSRKYCSPECSAIRQRMSGKVYRASNKAKARRAATNDASQARLFQDDPVAYTANVRLKAARQRATKYGMPFDLSLADIVEMIQTGKCAVTGQPFKLYAPGENRGRQQTDSFSLDKIEPPLGYVKGNCRGVVWSYNETKGAMTLAHMRTELALQGVIPYSQTDPRFPILSTLGSTIRARAFKSALSIPQETQPTNQHNTTLASALEEVAGPEAERNLSRRIGNYARRRGGVLNAVVRTTFQDGSVISFMRQPGQVDWVEIPI